MNVYLQQATPADIPDIRTMAQRIWRAHYPDIIGKKQVEYMLDLNYSHAALQRQIEEGQVFYLAAKDGDVLGFLAVSDQGEGRFFLHKFYLDNEKRGRGLGKIVFGLLLARFPSLRELRLTVNRQNYKSVNFYFKIGFIIERCVDIPIGESFEMNDFQMVLRVNQLP